jgi:protein-tyrosine phosphatase
VYGAVPSRPIVASAPRREILVVCTGNIARSAMGEAMLRARLEERGVEASVRSAGLLPWPGPPPALVLEVMRDYGLDLAAHGSQALTRQLVTDADLVLTMTRDHAGGVLARDPDARDRTFLIVELARLGADVGGPAPGEPLRAWAARVAARRPSGPTVGRPDEEVADPLNESIDVYRATAARLDAAASAIASLLAP